MIGTRSNMDCSSATIRAFHHKELAFVIRARCWCMIWCFIRCTFCTSIFCTLWKDILLESPWVISRRLVSCANISTGIATANMGGAFPYQLREMASIHRESTGFVIVVLDFTIPHFDSLRACNLCCLAGKWASKIFTSNALWCYIAMLQWPLGLCKMVCPLLGSCGQIGIKLDGCYTMHHSVFIVHIHHVGVERLVDWHINLFFCLLIGLIKIFLLIFIN